MSLDNRSHSRSRSPMDRKIRTQRYSYRDAPYRQDSRRGFSENSLYNKCKRPCHFARECPNVALCHNCGLPGHVLLSLGFEVTPQWRTGPLGPKTLCNACGVRFKSGRLFPEYRPARSPSFSQEIHSNSHRKVLEIRRKKENLSEPDLTPMFHSF